MGIVAQRPHKALRLQARELAWLEACKLPAAYSCNNGCTIGCLQAPCMPSLTQAPERWQFGRAVLAVSPA